MRRFVFGRRSARAALAASCSLVLSGLTTAAAGADRYVAPGGSDDADGSQGAPWATLQHAADTAQPGDTVHVADGNYQGFDVETVASEAAPLVFVGDSGAGAIIDVENPVTEDGINVENAAWITIQGFTVQGMARTGIRVVESPHVTVRGNRTLDNFKWGILTGCSEDILIEDNETAGSEDEHGIYHSNSADRAVIRRNLVHDNNTNGIHINGDIDTGCEGIAFDGVISDIVVDSNIIWNNGDDGGGSGINCDGVQDSLFQNNLLFEAHASGMSFYRIDGAEAARGNIVLHNTVVVAADGRWALNFLDGATDGFVRNNILFGASADRGSIRVSDDSLDGLDSDYNVFADSFTADGDETILDFGGWQALGFDAHSILSDPPTVFIDVATGKYGLLATSPAVDAGDPENYAAVDLLGGERPYGEAPDAGAFEYGAVVPPDTSAVAAIVSVGAGVGGGSGDGDGAGSGTGAGDGGANGAGPSGPGAPSANATGTAGDGGGDAAEDGGDDGCGCRIEAAGEQPSGFARVAPLALLAASIVAARRRRGSATRRP